MATEVRVNETKVSAILITLRQSFADGTQRDKIGLAVNKVSGLMILTSWNTDTGDVTSVVVDDPHVLLEQVKLAVEVYDRVNQGPA